MYVWCFGGYNETNLECVSGVLGVTMRLMCVRGCGGVNKTYLERVYGVVGVLTRLTLSVCTGL